MTRNRPPAHTGWPVGNQGRFRYDLPEPERDDTEVLGLPVPEWVDGWAIPREKEEAR